MSTRELIHRMMNLFTPVQLIVLTNDGYGIRKKTAEYKNRSNVK